MGKNKEQKMELLNAFSRMNYLYQAAIVASKALPESILGNYYGRLMKEVSKKVVEKIHPNIKRSLCASCSYPLFTNDHHATVKVKTYRKKKRKTKKNARKNQNANEEMSLRGRRVTEGNLKRDYPLSQKMKKNLKPNRLVWCCNKCGYLRTFLQRPSHYLWIEKFEEENGQSES